MENKHKTPLWSEYAVESRSFFYSNQKVLHWCNIFLIEVHIH